jgi:2'-5' RNA ligase
MSLIRTFVAVETPPDIRQSALRLIEKLKAAQAKIRWVDSESMHWTTNFLGDVPDIEIPGICAEVAAAARPFTPFDLEVRGIGAFPSPSRPRTIWLGVTDGAEQMELLHAALSRHLANLGFRPEGRRFRPHLTLGRVRESTVGLKELAELLEKHADHFAGRMSVDEVVVFSSRLEKSGAVHERLGAGELAG